MHFDLTISSDTSNLTADLRLCDEHGRQIAYRQTDFKLIPVSKRRALFDLRDHVRYYVDPGDEAEAIAEIGVCIAEDLLGEEVFKRLWLPQNQRTLCIKLPGATEEENTLAAALARVPWEIARPSKDKQTLGERFLLVRVVHDGPPPTSEAISLGQDDPLRVLFVFAEARGSRPLAARKERREILKLFQREIYPKRRVVAHVLAHGATRERLQAQISDSGGYHAVHWSGHGHLNRLELAKAGGGRETITGEELLGLFTQQGGLIPRFFFLSACHSGDILDVKDWNTFLAASGGLAPGTKSEPPAGPKGIQIAEERGYTGTAHALLSGGVQSVMAMRYAVGDDYARDLSLAFYRHLLADGQPKTVSQSLSLARKELLGSAIPERSQYLACDHATPVLYGAESAGWQVANARSPELEACNRRMHQVAELTLGGHQHFVGRTWELDGLGAEFIGPRTGAAVKPVALITGLGGMGKTALAAEALSLWESRFDWIFLYQAKPNALSFDSFLRDIHLRLVGELGRYHEHVKSHSGDTVYRDPDASFTGQGRFEKLTRNLVRAMRDESILLVLDNFETNVKPTPEPGTGPGEGVWTCQDPEWDRCLARLASELSETPSRLLITSRRPLAALANGPVHYVRLGPLPAGEAALYLREHADLSKMILGDDKSEKALAIRLLDASRFHPLLMDRLARLATGGTVLRPKLMDALDALEKSRDHSRLPGLFAVKPGDQSELAYLDDALGKSIDQLVASCSPDARRLLWVIAVANGPVSPDLIRAMWCEICADEGQLEHSLQQLAAVGLTSLEQTAHEDNGPNVYSHELVRERILAWMGSHETDRGNLTERSIRLSYAESLEGVFRTLEHCDMAKALLAGGQAIVYSIQAGEYHRSATFACNVITSATEPHFLEGLLGHLRAAADEAPAGEARWSWLGNLADALARSGRPDLSLGVYERAAAQAVAAIDQGGEGGKPALSDLAWIRGNWALALGDAGYLEASRLKHLESAAAERMAGNPEIDVISSELEALRIEIIQGRVAEVLPQVERHVEVLLAWWSGFRLGQLVHEAPDREVLARSVIAALDVARDAYWEEEDWKHALETIEKTLELERELNRSPEDIAATRLNRAVALIGLQRLIEARAEIEHCMGAFQEHPVMYAKSLSALADLLDNQGDVAGAIEQERRALAKCEQLPDPCDRAVSHYNLADYLERNGAPEDQRVSSLHRLANLVYALVTGVGPQLFLDYVEMSPQPPRTVENTLLLPRVADLLTDPAFQPLADWLRGRGVTVEEVQGRVDEVLKEVGRLAQEHAERQKERHNRDKASINT